MYNEIENAINTIRANNRKRYRDMVIVTLISIGAVFAVMWALERQLVRVAVIDQETIAQHNMERSQ